MGLREWFRSKPNGESPTAETSAVVGHVRDDSREKSSDRDLAFQIDVEILGPSVSGELELSGTTTICSDAVESFVARHGIVAGGYFEGFGVLQRELNNPVNSDAVVVLADGERIGYAPSYAAELLPVSDVGSLAVPLRLFTSHDGTRRWTRAFIWLDGTPPQWLYSEASPPPLTSGEKAQAHASDTSRMVKEALAEGGPRAEHFKAGLVDGFHFLELVEPIKEMKRQDRNDEALQLIYMAIEGAEGGREGGSPAPWYTEQAAIVHRKLGQRNEEIAVLGRWLAFVPAERQAQTGIGQRLAKLTSGR